MPAAIITPRLPRQPAGTITSSGTSPNAMYWGRARVSATSAQIQANASGTLARGENGSATSPTIA
jgi:hypothetical protein